MRGSLGGGGSSGGRDGEIEAFVIDRYLESLLARTPADTDGVPPDLGQAAQRLTGALPRYHPSFRFEEALSAQLAAAAARIAGGEVIRLPIPAGDAGSDVERLPRGRPVVIRGVLTSAAISLLGAAYVAWRRGRPAADPMSRAVRAVARARII